MSVSISDLLGKKHSIVRAEQTFKSMKAAAETGNLRLAVSRGITAIIQATAAAYHAPSPVVRRAEALIQAIRMIIHRAVIEQVAASGIGSFGAKFPKLPKWERKLPGEKERLEKRKEELLKISPDEEDIERKVLELRTEELPFKTFKFPAAPPSQFHSAAPAGIFIPTPGDPWASKTVYTVSQFVNPDFIHNIETQPDGIKVYGAPASKAITKILTMLYTRFPQIRQSLGFLGLVS